MSIPWNSARMPKSPAAFVVSATSAAWRSAFVGMQPRCRQVPPTLSRSMRATRIPSVAPRKAAA